MSVTMPQSKMAVIAIWVGRVLLAALFLYASVLKLSGAQMEIDIFDQVGLGQWLRYATGLAELVGGIALLVPAVSAFGALLLLAVDIGAFGAQVSVLHQDWIHTVVIGLILIVLIYVQRGQILSRLR